MKIRLTYELDVPLYPGEETQEVMEKIHDVIKEGDSQYINEMGVMDKLPATVELMKE